VPLVAFSSFSHFRRSLLSDGNPILIHRQTVDGTRQ